MEHDAGWPMDHGFHEWLMRACEREVITGEGETKAALMWLPRPVGIFLFKHSNGSMAVNKPEKCIGL